MSRTFTQLILFSDKLTLVQNEWFFYICINITSTKFDCFTTEHFKGRNCLRKKILRFLPKSAIVSSAKSAWSINCKSYFRKIYEI